MGSTRTAIESGNPTLAFVLAIEGYPRLITSYSPSSADSGFYTEHADWSDLAYARLHGESAVHKDGGDRWACRAVATQRWYGGDGYVEAAAAAPGWFVGLTSGSTIPAAWTDLDYGILVSTDGWQVVIYEGGVVKLTLPRNTGAATSKYRIRVDDGVVTYWGKRSSTDRWTVLYTSAVAATYPLITAAFGEYTGYSVLDYCTITRSSIHPVIEAWRDTDWSQAVRGLSIPQSISAELNPWSPEFVSSAMTFNIDAVDGDVVGTALHLLRPSTARETSLTASVTPNSIYIPVVSTARFPDSGTIYIGNECITYGSKSDTKFWISARGKYAPFTYNESSTSRWAHGHEISNYAYGANIAPNVTNFRSSYLGAWAGLWVHRVVNGTIDSLSEAELVWAGKIDNIADLPETGATSIECESVLGCLNRVTLLQEQYQATLREGLYWSACNWQAGNTATPPTTKTFQMRAQDATQTAGIKTARTLRAVASGASESWELNETWYTVDDMVRLVNRWFVYEKAAGRLNASWQLSAPTEIDGVEGKRCRLRVTFDTSTSETCVATLWMNSSIAYFLGFGGRLQDDIGVDALVHISGSATGNDPVVEIIAPGQAVKVAVFSGNSIPGGTYGSQAGSIYVEGSRFGVSKYQGQWVTTTKPFLPVEARNWSGILDGGEYGFLLINDTLCIARRESDTEFSQVGVFTIADYNSHDPQHSLLPTVYYGDDTELTAKQVLMLQSDFKGLITRLLASTGGFNYNHSLYDKFSRQVGAGVPWQLLGDDFLNSAQRLGDSSILDSLTLVVEKPTKLADVLLSELTLRGAHLVFRYGHLVIARPIELPDDENYQPPHYRLLNTTNKASPVDSPSIDRTAGRQTTEYCRNQLKVQYGRLWDGTFLHTIEISNQDSVASTGKQLPITISARNLIGDSHANHELAESLVSDLAAAMMCHYGYPLTVVTRTVDRSFALAAPGDCVRLVDSHVRDPRTGTRGLGGGSKGYLGWIRSIDFDWGSCVGEAEIVLSRPYRAAVYAPGGMVVIDEVTGDWENGYNPLTNEIVIEPIALAPPSGAGDIYLWEPDHTIDLVCLDPTDPENPVTYSRTVTAVDYVNNTITLDSPLTSWSGSLYSSVYIQPQTVEVAGDIQPYTYLAASGTNFLTDSTDACRYAVAEITTSGVSTVDGTALPEYIPTVLTVSGAPLSPVLPTLQATAANNAIQYKHNNNQAAPQWEAYFNTVISGATAWQTVGSFPVYVGANYPPPGQTRKLYVAPSFYLYDGAEPPAQCRITVSTQLPKPNPTLLNSSYFDVMFNYPCYSAEWTTTSGAAQIATTSGIEIPGNGPIVYATVEFLSATTSGLIAYQGTPVLSVGPYEAA